MPKFFISVLCLNRIEQTIPCIEAILKGDEDFHLCITDNGCNDGSTEYFHSLKDPRVSIIWHDCNMGFIRPMNTAFELAKLSGVPYFVALNNDTLPPPGWLDKLVKPMSNPTVVLTGPLGGCNMLNDVCMGEHGNVTEYLEGSCLMVKVATVGKFGPLFSEYLTFAYGEDSDLSLRMRQRGYQICKVNLHVPHTDKAGTIHKTPGLKEASEEPFQKNHEVLRRIWKGYLLSRKFGSG